jgi:hypothetical protein
MLLYSRIAEALTPLIGELGVLGHIIANVRTYGINENFCFGKFFIALTNSLISP